MICIIDKWISVKGFGKFHYTLLLMCGLIYADTALGITLLSFVLPSAQCDFKMTSQDKGWLTAAPMFGELSTFRFLSHRERT